MRILDLKREIAGLQESAAVYVEDENGNLWEVRTVDFHIMENEHKADFVVLTTDGSVGANRLRRKIEAAQ